MSSATRSRKTARSIDISWVELDGVKALVAYDTVTNDLVYWLIDYCLYLATTISLSPKTIENQILYVQRFLEFMLNGGVGIDAVSDKTLADFRDAELERVKTRKNWSGSKQAAHRTVNAKLRRVYHFLEWLQVIEGCSAFLIGPTGCRVRSALGSQEKVIVGSRGHRLRKICDRDRYPLLYRNVGEGSTHRTKYIATGSDVDQLEQYFLARYPNSLAHRNILILELANRVGLRRGSINSLRCDQFSRERLEYSEDDWGVVPDAQKFGYEVQYKIPFRLAFRICDYIETVRRPFLISKGWPESRTEGRLFFSFRDGKPLTDRAISQIFGHANDLLGNDEHGANIHSLRRKHANDEIDRETRLRSALGLDTSVSSIAASVSMTMGQTNPESLNPYVSRAQGRFRQNAGKTDVERIADLQLENQHLKIKLAEAQETLQLQAKMRKRR